MHFDLASLIQTVGYLGIFTIVFLESGLLIGFFFHKKYLERAQGFYDKHGGKTIILARFIPVIRAFAPVVAGAGKMDYKKFLIFNLVGGVLWAIGVTLAGYYLGNLIPDVDKYLLPIVGLIVIASVLPALHHILVDGEIRASIINKFESSSFKRSFQASLIRKFKRWK
ncbi:MAG: VTT domain-containing protein [Candidatus Daviesbacteria bacterium]|nr:VTT domain-containing protein [Candidatus Daviesbacteria bacterium]